MSVAIPIPLLQHLPDVNVTPAVGVDEYALTYDHDTARFVLRAPAAPFAGLLATGATVGATSQAQAFTLGVVSPFLAPAADSTTAWQVRKADKTTAVVTVDTTNGRVGIGAASLDNKLDVGGTIRAAATGNVLATIQSYSGDNNTAGLVLAGAATNATWYILTNRSALSGAADNLAIYKNAGTAGTKLVITDAGLVGIGTTGPGSRLDIDAGALTMKEMTAPTGVADKAIVYAKDNGSGKTQICCKLGDDVEIVLATQA